MKKFKWLAILNIAAFVIVFLIFKMDLGKWMLNSKFSNKNHKFREFAYIHQVRECLDFLKIVIAVCSAPKNKIRRMAIRETWGHARNNSSRLVFFLGKTDYLTQDDIDDESKKFRDIVQENYTDSYVNLSIKSLSYLRWVKHSCRKTQFVLKTDDDVYINLPLLMKTLESITETQFIMGNLFKRARPIRTNGTKWFTSYAQYKGNIFPDYVSGSAYLLSVDLVPKLYAESFKRKIFWLEDIYITGILADAVKAIRINNDKFSYFKRPGYGCSFKNLISGHRVTPRVMKIIHEQLNSTIDCEV